MRRLTPVCLHQIVEVNDLQRGDIIHVGQLCAPGNMWIVLSTDMTFHRAGSGWKANHVCGLLATDFTMIGYWDPSNPSSLAIYR